MSFLNAGIGFATEWKAASALAGLRKQAVFVARVLRDGAECQLPAQALVTGDVVLLAADDREQTGGCSNMPSYNWVKRL